MFIVVIKIYTRRWKHEENFRKYICEFLHSRECRRNFSFLISIKWCFSYSSFNRWGMYSYSLKITIITMRIVQKSWFFDIMTYKEEKLHFIMLVSVWDLELSSELFKMVTNFLIPILVYVYTTVVAYITIPAISLLIDFIIPSNHSEEKSFPIELDYGVDTQHYFYYLFIHSYMTIAMIANLIASCDTTYMLYAQHGCALFAIVR